MEGLPAIRRHTGEGINVNVTRLYRASPLQAGAEAYKRDWRIDWLREGRWRELSRWRVFSSAGSMCWWIQSWRKKPRQEARTRKRPAACEVRPRSPGRGESRDGLKARPQHVLWASTSTKNPEYPDLKYVEPLIGPETINTMPLETLEAYRDHGQPEPRLEQGVEEAERMLRDLAAVGIDIDRVTQQLEEEAVEKFNKPYDKVIKTLTEKVQALQKGR